MYVRRMNIGIPLASLLIVVAANSPANAQTLINADSVALQPTISRDAKGFKSCGVRAVVVIANGAAGQVYDFSLNLYPDSLAGMVKAGKYSEANLLDRKASAKVRAHLPPPTSFWIARVDQGAPVTPKTIIKADSPGFILGETDFGPTMEALLDLANGTKMQFATRYKDEPIEKVVSISSKMAQGDLDALNSCLQGLQGRLDAMLKEHEPKR